MAAPKRSKAKRDKDLAEVASRYLKGESQVEIAESLGVTQQQVSYDLRILRRQWLKDAARDFDEARAQELAKIDELEREYWRTWRDSKREFESKLTEQVTGKESVIRARIYREMRYGEMRYLDGVQWCIERRCKLLGLDAPLRQEISGRDGMPIVISCVEAVQPVSDE